MKKITVKLSPKEADLISEALDMLDTDYTVNEDNDISNDIEKIREILRKAEKK